MMGPGRGHRGRKGAQATARAKNFKGSFRRLLGEFKPLRMKLVLVLFAVVAANIFNITAPRMVEHAIDIVTDALGLGTGIDFSMLARVLVGLLCLYVLSSVFRYFQEVQMVGVTQDVMFTLRRKVDEKMGRLPLSYFDHNERGDILSRSTNDIDNVANSMQQSVTQVLSAVVTLIGVLIMMLSLSPLLTLMTILMLPLIMAGTMFITRRSQKLFVKQWAVTGDLNGHIEEMFTGHSVVKLYGQEENSIRRFEEQNEELYTVGWKAQFLSSLIHPLMNLIGNLGFIGVCVVGALMVISGRMSVGGVTAFITYNKQFTQPISQVANIMNVLQSAVASAERVYELLDEPEEIESEDKGVSLAHAKGAVTFEHVDFGYTDDKTLIQDMNLHVEPGQMVAIVGPTGAGKTTLVNLLMRFYDVKAGRILIDGVDIKTLPREKLREALGMVLQDTWLISGTIRENIAYGKKGADEAAILRAAKAAGVDHFVRTLPEGYDTLLLEDARNISQGQRQLLTIARTLLSDPPILILDEATSSVDTRTEVLIQEAMRRLMAGRTSFVIAHRLSTIRGADVILVMQDGSIVETGTHDELMAKGGAYARLYNSQFAGGEEASA